MLRYTIRRTLYAIPIILGVLLLTHLLFFGLVPVEVIARQNLGQKNPTPQQIQQWLQDHGYGEPTEAEMKGTAFGRFLLGAGIRPAAVAAPEEEGAGDGHGGGAPAAAVAEKPAVEEEPEPYEPSAAARILQLKRSTVDMLLFNFGKSDTTGEDIKERIQRGAIPSLIVGGLIFWTALFVTLMFAIVAAYFRGTYVDQFGTFLCVLLMSISAVVYVIGLQFLMGKILKYGPVWGFDLSTGNAAKFLIVPVVVGVIMRLGAETRLFRTFLLDEVNQDYVRTARAKGVAEQAVLLKHVLKNAMIPVITTTVTAIPALILGSLLIENFFGIPGLGGYLVDAINSQDFAVVRAMVFLGTLLYIVGLILTDILYALADPRVRLE